ncbi:MAG: hypothetical protein JW763_06290 [candidate division Zixibacteria bacterium]|nr:hypothetical protein [candidate division Zixibacteria bacterium]
MARVTFGNPAIRVASILIVAVMLFAGCSNSPLESPADNSDSQQPALLGRTAAAVTAAQLNASIFHAEEVISAAEGGRLTLFDVIMDIPPGALNSDTLFSIDIPDLTVFYNEFGTSGLVFNKPVTVTMSYRDADLSQVVESTIRIAFFDPETQQYEDVECQLDMDNMTVTAELHHFSAYGLISDWRTGFPL